jgi:hypothetical protein
MKMNQQAWLDQEDARLTAVVRKHGWMIQYIGGGTCSRPGCDAHHEEGVAFAYTVGLFGMNHPEMLIFGVSPEVASLVINQLGDLIRKGSEIIPGQLVELDAWNRRILPEPVPNPGEILFTANRYYLRPDEYSVPALQLTHDDDQGLFPWDEGYSGPEQPRPGTFRA